MEFMMSYGFAILVILVTIGALAYSGVLSPDKFLPEKCVLPPGIFCVDFIVESSRVTLSLQNVFGETITINSIDLNQQNGGSCSSSDSLVLNNGQIGLFTILDCNNGNVGDKYKADIELTFTPANSLTRVSSGSIVAAISKDTSTTSSNICQNAEDVGLCNGLDILFGIGYKAACCSEHTLCCG